MTIIHSIVKRSPFKGPSPLDLFIIGMQGREYYIDQFLKMSKNHIKNTRISFTKWSFILSMPKLSKDFDFP